MRMLSILTVALVGIVLLAGCATPHVYPLAVAQTKKKEGVAYALPRTVIQVKIPIVKTTYKKGPLVDYADTYKNRLSLDPEEIQKAKKCTSSWSKYSINTDGLELAAFSEADPSQIYVVELVDSPFHDVNTIVTLDDLGIITSASNEIVHKEIDFAVSTLKTIASIASPLAAAGPEEKPSPQDLDDLVRVAQETYEAIRAIRVKRVDLVGGMAPEGLTEDLLKTMLKESRAQEDVLLSQFTFTKKETTWDAIFTIRPCGCAKDKGHGCGNTSASSTKDGCACCSAGSTNTVTLLTVGSFAGVSKLGQDLLSTLPADFNPKKLPDAEIRKDEKELALSLQLNVDWDAQLCEKLASLPQKTGPRSFYYRVPAQTTARLMKNDEVMKQSSMPVAQLGRTCSLPVQLLGRRLKQDVEWSTAGGGLKKITVVRETYNPETIEKAGAAVGQMSDELTRITRENDLIEARQKNTKLKLQPLTDAVSMITGTGAEESE